MSVGPKQCVLHECTSSFSGALVTARYPISIYGRGIIIVRKCGTFAHLVCSHDVTYTLERNAAFRDDAMNCLVLIHLHF
jgi:hypothetical protein